MSTTDGLLFSGFVLLVAFMLVAYMWYCVGYNEGRRSRAIEVVVRHDAEF